MTAAVSSKTPSAKTPEPWFEALLFPFQQSIVNPRTGQAYARRVRGFLAWATAERGADGLGNMPVKALFEYFEKNKDALTQNEKNTAIGALRAFVGWATSSGVTCPAFEYPETVKIEKKPEEKEADVLVASNTEPASSNGKDPQPAPIAQFDGSSTPPPVLDRTAEMRTPPPSVITTPETDLANPAVSQGSAPRTTQKRGLRIDPLEVLCPTDGFLRVARSSATGKPEHIGEYQSQHLVGFTDLSNFVERQLKAPFGPKPGEPSVTFYITRFNRTGDPVGQPVDLTVAAPSGNSPSVVGLREEILGSFAGIKEAIVKEQEERLGTAASVLEKEGKHDTAAIIRELTNVLKPDTRPFETLVGQVLDKFEKVQAAVPAPPSAEVTLMRDMMNRMMPPAGAAGVSPGGQPAPEVMSAWATSVKTMRDVFAPPVVQQQYQPSAEVAELRAEVRMLREHSARPSEEDDMQKTSKKFQLLKEMAGEFFGGGERGGGEGLAQYIPDVLSTINNAVNKFVPVFSFKKGGETPTVASQVTENPSGQKALKAAGKKALPADAQQALVALREVELEVEEESGEPTQPMIEAYEESVANSLFQLIMSMRNSGDPHWIGIGDTILARFKDATIRAQIHALIVDTFAACGATKMLTEDPDLADRIAEVVADKYPEIHEAIPQWGKKALIDQNPEEEYDEEGKEGEEEDDGEEGEEEDEEEEDESEGEEKEESGDDEPTPVKPPSLEERRRQRDEARAAAAAEKKARDEAIEKAKKQRENPTARAQAVREQKAVKEAPVKGRVVKDTKKKQGAKDTKHGAKAQKEADE